MGDFMGFMALQLLWGVIAFAVGWSMATGRLPWFRRRRQASGE